MTIRFDCSGCGKNLKVPETAAGRRAKCPVCETYQPVPLVSAPDPAGESSVKTPPHEPLEQATSPVPPEPARPKHAAKATPRAIALDTTRVQRALDVESLIPSKVSPYVTRFAWLEFRAGMGACILFAVVMAIIGLPLEVLDLVPKIFPAEDPNSQQPYMLGATYVVFLPIFHTIKVGISGLFGLALLRRESSPLSAITRVFPYLFKLFALIIIVDVIIGLAIGAILAPQLLRLGGVDLGMPLWVIHLGVAVVVVPLLVGFLLDIYVAEYFILDCSAGVIESMRLSRRHLARNRMGLLSALFWTHMLAGIAVFFTCGIGAIMAIPYFAILSTSYYLASTGQLDLPEQ